MSVPSVETFTAALKEWAVAVTALAQGDMILLLRKGGIREQGKTFTIEHPQIWLYPTYEHQKPNWLKPAWANQVTAVPSGWHPDTVTLSAWATITHTFQVSEAATVESLLPFHIWNEAFVAERLKWKPKLPLSVLLLRVYRLAEPETIPYAAEYGGCKSWIHLQTHRSPDATLPVFTDQEYTDRVRAIESIITR